LALIVHDGTGMRNAPRRELMDTNTSRPSPKSDDACDDDNRSAGKGGSDQEKTTVKKVDRRVPEGPDNLRDREAAFKRRHGTKE
jgi:hypothetical protein